MTNESSDHGLSALSDEELLSELARRRASKLIAGGFLMAEEGFERHAHADSLVGLQDVLKTKMMEQDRSRKPCPKCKRLTGVKSADRARKIRTMSGELSFCRHYHYCDACRAGFYPLDIELELPTEGELSPKMLVRVLDFGVTVPFEEAESRWFVHHSGSRVSENLFRRATEFVGKSVVRMSPSARHIAMRKPPKSRPSTLVVQADGSMISMRREWKEAKLGIIYRTEQQVSGKETRGYLSAPRFAGTMNGIDRFRSELDAALDAERALEAKQVVWLGDGAAWIWNLQDELSPNAVQILDFTHMKDHAVECGKVLLGDSPWLPIWTQTIVKRVELGRAQEVIDELHDLRKDLRGTKREAVNNLARYYTNHLHRIDYPRFRALGLPIGSGAIESAHRHVLQVRMKRAGQHWSPEGARRMTSLRCAYKTAGPEAFEDFVLAAAA